MQCSIRLYVFRVDRVSAYKEIRQEHTQRVNGQATETPVEPRQVHRMFGLLLVAQIRIPIDSVLGVPVLNKGTELMLKDRERYTSFLNDL